MTLQGSPLHVVVHQYRCFCPVAPLCQHTPLPSHRMGGKTTWTLSCAFHCPGTEMIYTTFTHNRQLKLSHVTHCKGSEKCEEHMSINYLLQCDNHDIDIEDDIHLCYIKHCASLSLTLWLVAGHSVTHLAQCVSFHCHSFHH